MTPGCAGSVSQAARCRSLSTSVTASCCRATAAATRLIGRSPSSPAAAVRGGRRPACLPAWRLHVDRARADGRARRLGPLPPAVVGPLPRPHAERGLQWRASPPGRDHQDRQYPRAPAAGRSGLAPAPAATGERRARAGAARASQLRSASGPMRAAVVYTHAWEAVEGRGKRRTIVAVAVARELGRPLLGVGDDGVTAHRQRLGEGSAPAQKDARSDRGTATSSPSQATLDSREQLRSSPRTTRSCGPDPRISAPTRRVDETAYALPHRNKEGPANTGLQAGAPAHLTNLTSYQLFCGSRH